MATRAEAEGAGASALATIAAIGDPSATEARVESARAEETQAATTLSTDVIVVETSRAKEAQAATPLATDAPIGSARAKEAHVEAALSLDVKSRGDYQS